jgi:NADPH-dependent 2,4-dienoyl-CoA reductase/sulfur reductase-like enzyme
MGGHRQSLRGHTRRHRIVPGTQTAQLSDQGLPGGRFGGYPEFEGIIPPVAHAERPTRLMTALPKQALTHAKVTSEAAVRTPDTAEAILAATEADLVSIVRVPIPDTHPARKAADGRASDIRSCIFCNQMCRGRGSRDCRISRLINPSAGGEFEWGEDRFIPAVAHKHILVVGACPAGLLPARATAGRGHRVEIAEASRRIGGQFRSARRELRRAQVPDLPD